MLARPIRPIFLTRSILSFHRSSHCKNSTLSSAITHNARISQFEMSRDVKGLLEYADANRGGLDMVNWATVFNRLGRMRMEAASSSLKDDESFVRVREEFERQLSESWIGVREASNIVHAYGLMGIRSEVVDRCLDDRARALVQNQVIKMFAESDRDWRGLLRYADWTKEEFNDVNWSTFFTRLSWLRRGLAKEVKNNEVFGRVRGYFEGRLEGEGMGWMGVREFASVVHSYGSMGMRSSIVFKCLGENAGRMVGQGSTQHISNCMYALAHLGVHENEFAKAVETEEIANYMLSEGNTRDISTVMWSFGTLRHKTPNFAKVFERTGIVEYYVGEGNPQEISSTMLSMAKLGQQAPALAKAIDSEDFVMKLVTQGNPQSIANTIWAMAKLGHDAPNLVEAIDKTEVATKIVTKGRPQVVANTIWAMEKLGHKVPTLARAINSEEIVMKFAGEPQEEGAKVGEEGGNCSKAVGSIDTGSNIGNSSSRARAKAKGEAIIRNKKIVTFSREGDWRGLLRYADERKRGFTDVNWATLFFSLGRMRRERELILKHRAFNRLRDNFERRVEESGLSWMGAREVGNVVHAYGIMHLKSKVLFRRLDEEAERIVKEGTTYQICNTVRSLAILLRRDNLLDNELTAITQHFASAINSPEAVARLTGEGRPKEIALTLWSMVALGHDVPNLASAVEGGGILRKIHREGSKEDWETVLWALEKLGSDREEVKRRLD